MALEILNSFKGEIAALSGAFFWAASSAVYSALGKHFSPLQLNLFKGLIASILTAITLFVEGELLQPLNQMSAGLQLLSGAISIGFGDTAYFATLKNLGPRRTLLMESLTAPVTALLASIWLHEQLNFSAWCGIGLTMGGVAWVVTERTKNLAIANSAVGQGIVWGILAVGAKAVGATLSRLAFVESNITPLKSTFLRLIAGTLIVLLLLLISRKNKKQINQTSRAPMSIGLLASILITPFFSTYLGIWLQQTALKEIPAGIAQTLSATSPLFILPIAISMGERISFRAFLGVIGAIAGIKLLFN